MSNHVYLAINAVQAELASTGIAKDKKNTMQGFNFRGIDDVYNALAPCLAKHKLCILPRILSREVVERRNAKGSALFYVTVEAEFDLVSSEDGSKHTIRTFGEAMDSGDKATNKAMSAAYKYAAFQAFAIPTESTAVDANSQTHEVAGLSVDPDLLSQAQEYARQGVMAFRKYYAILEKPDRAALRPEMGALQLIAEQADAQMQDQATDKAQQVISHASAAH